MYRYGHIDEDTVLSVTLTADQSRKLRHDLNIAIGRVEADLNGDAGFIEGLRAVVGLPETE